MHYFYLHGFASSARSSKAAFFARKLEELGHPLHTPDFNEPEFSTLTVTRMVDQVINGLDALPPARAALIGSSLGGFVAVQAALRRPGQIDRLVLLAPALDFSGNRLQDLGDRGLAEWQKTNRLDVFHYGYGRTIPVHYDLYTDANRYDCASAQLSMPIQIFQGRRDTAVNPDSVERWARLRTNVELHMLDDDHQLLGSLEFIWREAARFLGVA
ncbi:MAG TPA: YqiA/YcfP family alpha/beta fold hydrolase [Vicinamibacterales bacterium]|nr:YqiA/YcfP family alpha/beta fold hydrolase [Vicinamibacterales bacterium]